MDSRDYICAFTIHDADEMPADFESPPGVQDCKGGLFLPQSEPDWLGRRAYPARIVLLTHDALCVIPHSKSREQNLLIPTRDLSALECGRILLSGWIGLYSGDARHVLCYNRRCALTVERFLAKLRALWLAGQDDLAAIGVDSPSQRKHGAALIEKFRHVLETEMLDGEQPLIHFFQPPVRRVRRRIFRYETWSAGDLIVLSRRRVLWITERRGKSYEPYGTVSYSAPIETLAEIACVGTCDGLILRVRLRSGLCWQLPVSDGYESNAQSFADAIRKSPNGSRENDALPVHVGCRGSGPR